MIAFKKMQNMHSENNDHPMVTKVFKCLEIKHENDTPFKKCYKTNGFLPSVFERANKDFPARLNYKSRRDWLTFNH